MPTTLSRIYYAQFSCSRDVSSSQLRSSQRFLLFFPFYTNSILTIRLFPRPSSVSSFVLYAGSRGVCARARPLVFQCVTRAQCETTSVEYVFSLSSRGCTGRKRIARSRRKPTKLTGSATVIRDAPSPNLQTPVSRFREPWQSAAASSCWLPCLRDVVFDSIFTRRSRVRSLHWSCSACAEIIDLRFSKVRPSSPDRVVIITATSRENKKIRKYCIYLTCASLSFVCFVPRIFTVCVQLFYCVADLSQGTLFFFGYDLLACGPRPTVCTVSTYIYIYTMCLSLKPVVVSACCVTKRRVKVRSPGEISLRHSLGVRACSKISVYVPHRLVVWFKGACPMNVHSMLRSNLLRYYVVFHDPSFVLRIGIFLSVCS